MLTMKCILGLVVLVVFSAAEEEVGDAAAVTHQNCEKFKALTVSEIIERANKDIVRLPGEPFIEDDIAYDSEAERNADPCTSRGCTWPKSSDGKVYIPYTLSDVYSAREVSVIERGLQSFHKVSCVRFIKRTSQTAYLAIQSLNGCYSSLGYRGHKQTLSLMQSGCVYHHTVQHEALHALGFHHEQARSDRDQYIRIERDNILPGREHNFQIVNTLNQGITYDYGSVMHYSRFAFSKNGKPTMVGTPDPLVEFGRATEMSQKDISRLNKLYKC